MCAQLTTEFQFNTSDKKEPNAKQASEPLRVLIIGNFSGRTDASQQASEASTGFKAVKLDKDNFDSVFETMGVTLTSEFSESPIVFSSIDDFHPDFMFEQMPVFSVFNLALKKLKKCKTYSEGLDILNRAGVNVVAAVAPSTPQNSTEPQNTGSQSSINLDEVLSSTTTAKPQTIQDVISEIVKPFAEVKPDARLEDLGEVLLDAASQTMRALLNSSAFKKLEALWRGVDFVNRRMDTDKAVELSIMDVSAQELLVDLKNNAPQTSKVYQALTSSGSVVSSKGFDVVIVDELNSTSNIELPVLENLSTILAESNSALFMDFDFEKIGCQSLVESPQMQGWMGAGQLSESPDYLNWKECLKKFKQLYLFAPQFLVRMPYGEKTSPLESFKFEELILSDQNDAWRAGFCWASASIAALLVAERIHISGASPVAKGIEQLPFFAVQYQGDVLIQPATAVVFSDQTVNYLSQLNVNCLLGSPEQNSLSLCSFNPFA